MNQSFNDQRRAEQLREVLSLFLSDKEIDDLQEAIRGAMLRTGLSGPALVEHVRSELNISSVFGPEDTGPVIAALRDMLDKD